MNVFFNNRRRASAGGDDYYGPYYEEPEPRWDREPERPAEPRPSGNWSHISGGRLSGTDRYSSGYDQYGWFTPRKSGSSGSSRSRGSSRSYAPIPIGQTTTSRTLYSGKPPSTEGYPELSLPAWGEPEKRRVRAEAQKLAGGDVLTIRRALQRATGRTYRNPMVASYVIGQALQNAGISLGRIRSAAERAAYGEVRGEWQGEQQRLSAMYAAQAAKWQAEYQAAWNQYLSTARTVQQTRRTYRTAYGGTIGAEGYGVGGAYGSGEGYIPGSGATHLVTPYHGPPTRYITPGGGPVIRLDNFYGQEWA